jgi:hypothetical protein
MSDTPETNSVLKEIKQHKIAFYTQEYNFEGGKVSFESPIVSLCRKLERERDEAADMVARLTMQGLTLMDANRMLKKKARKYKKAIIECLQNNRHLADGDDCTLIKLKKVIYDDKKNN